MSAALSHVCVQVVTDNSCAEWARQVTLLPPLSAAQGLELAGMIIGCWLLSEFIGVVLARIFPH